MKKKENNKIIIKNNKGFEVVLLPLGASIYSFKVDGECLTLTPKNVDDFGKQNIYYGKTIGPVPNRINDGKVIINNKEYQLERNEGNNTLHSSLGICNRIFDYEIKEDKKEIIVHFSYMKKDMEDGLPGNIKYDIHYYLKKDENILSISFEAVSDQDTMMGLTNHTYFNLGDKNIDNLKLTIPSHRFIETGKEDLIPLREREVLPCLDFNNGKYLNNDINDPYLQNHRSYGYDHCFLLDKGNIILENDKYKMIIDTDFKALQIYSDNYEDGIEMINTKDKNHRGLAMESQDSILNRKILEKGQFYNRKISYHFKKK